MSRGEALLKKVSAAEAKANLSALVGEVAFGGQHVVIERRGKPLAALVSMGDLKWLEEMRATSAQPQGALALVGAWRDIPEETIDALVADIYAAREKDSGRLVDLEA